MAGKVLLGLLAAAAVTGSAVLYSGSSYTCPLSGACPTSCPVSADVTACDASVEEASACCASKGRAAVACCEGMDETLATGGDAVAALTGGVGLGR